MPFIFKPPMSFSESTVEINPHEVENFDNRYDREPDPERPEDRIEAGEKTSEAGEAVNDAKQPEDLSRISDEDIETGLLNEKLAAYSAKERGGTDKEIAVNTEFEHFIRGKNLKKRFWQWKLVTEK